MHEKILSALSTVKYPGFDKDIVTLGMVEEVSVKSGAVHVNMKKLTAGDDTKNALAREIGHAVSELGFSAKVVFAGSASSDALPPPHHEMPPKKEIKDVKYIVPVASGKGGVGKSTTAVNLSVTLARQGLRVGLLDLDVYGPSIPTMLGLEERHAISKDQKLKPAEKHGLKVVSVGLLMEKGAALIWRGPIVAKMVKQLIYDVEWGELDYLVLDLPPGTGDVQITMLQSVPISGAMVVTTPQDVALNDASKAINMFSKTETHVLGIVENMSFFICPHCGKGSEIFGKGGGKRESERTGVPLLGQIPLEGKITQTGDSGKPIALEDGPVAEIFRGIALKVTESLKTAPLTAG
ncbi:MAG: iron-sulfur cluster carrier protein [bacterium]|nr:MAG: iron-sulfur cluster carrier protein [bacterium]